MQRGRTKRCQVPIRTRRRQSDAKWRASVASCYETLKFIIPNGQALPKRKASKSLILQETEKHIGNLEKTMSRLLNIEAQDRGLGVLWRNRDKWSPATLEDLQNDFARQQTNIFHQSSLGRRCYNMLHDIQEEIINLSVDYQNMAFLPLGSNDIRAIKDISVFTRKHRTSTSRCRYESEKAAQRILSAYNTGEVVKAVIPTAASSHAATATTVYSVDQQQAALATPLNMHSVSMATCSPVSIPGTTMGTTIKLQKFSNMFVSAKQAFSRNSQSGKLTLQSLSGMDGAVEHQAEREPMQTVHEVPRTPQKVYGIARNDVMMSQNGETPEIFNSTFPKLPLPSTNRLFANRERDSRQNHQPFVSSVRKKLDFTVPMCEAHSENDSDANTSNNTSHCSNWVCSTDCGLTSPKYQVIYTTGLTPVKSDMITVGSNSQILTPLKLSSDLCTADTDLFSPNCTWTLCSSVDARVPQACLSDLEELEDVDDQSLLCTETFDLDSEASELQERTPGKLSSPSEHFVQKGLICKKRCQCRRKEIRSGLCASRPRPKCRKRLDRLYEEVVSEENKEMHSDPAAGDPVDGSAGCSDFDGYLLYYQQVAPEVRKRLGSCHNASSLTAIVSDMWSQLPKDDRNTMMTLAALENQDSNSSSSGGLSQDLEELNVTPIAGKQFTC